MFGAVNMPIDSYGHVHTPIRPKGYRVTKIKFWIGCVKGDKWYKKFVGYLNLKKPLIGDVRLDIGHKQSWLMQVWFVLDVEGLSKPLFCLDLSFCRCCGHELGFGSIYGICGECATHLEDEAEDFEVDAE
jgi:hypothetical protein